MDAAEVVIREMDSDSSLQVFQFLRERIGKAREATKRHAHREVLALDVAGGNVGLAGIADSHLGYNLDDWAWGVSFGPVLAIVSVELRQLRKVHIKAERFLDYLRVEVESVCGQLHLVR